MVVRERGRHLCPSRAVRERPSCRGCRYAYDIHQGNRAYARSDRGRAGSGGVGRLAEIHRHIARDFSGGHRPPPCQRLRRPWTRRGLREERRECQREDEQETHGSSLPNYIPNPSRDDDLSAAGVRNTRNGDRSESPEKMPNLNVYGTSDTSCRCAPCDLPAEGRETGKAQKVRVVPEANPGVPGETGPAGTREDSKPACRICALRGSRLIDSRLNALKHSA